MMVTTKVVMDHPTRAVIIRTRRQAITTGTGSTELPNEYEGIEMGFWDWLLKRNPKQPWMALRDGEPMPDVRSWLFFSL
jgi:hypothetical protein